MEKAGIITPIPNPKWNGTMQGSICKHSKFKMLSVQENHVEDYHTSFLA